MIKYHDVTTTIVSHRDDDCHLCNLRRESFAEQDWWEDEKKRRRKIEDERKEEED